MKNKSIIAVLGVSACLAVTPNIVTAEESTDVVIASDEDVVDESVICEETEVTEESTENSNTATMTNEDSNDDPTQALEREIEEYNNRLPEGYKAIDVHGVVYLIAPDGEQIPYAYYASCLGAGKSIEDAFAHCEEENEDVQTEEEADEDEIDIENNNIEETVIQDYDSMVSDNDIDEVDDSYTDDDNDSEEPESDDEQLEETIEETVEETVEETELVNEQEVEEAEIEKVDVEDIKPIFSHGYRFTGDEIYKLAQLMLHEANNQCINGKIAIVEVIVNRMKSNDFPDTVEEVIYQPSQFTGARRSRYIVPTASDIALVEDVLLGKVGALHDSDILYFKNTSTCNGIKASTQRNWGDLKWQTYIQDHAFYSAK